jgi:hypothetical protein
LLRIVGMVNLVQDFGVLIVLRRYSIQVNNGRCQEIITASSKAGF